MQTLDETMERQMTARPTGKPIPYLREWRDAKLMTAGELAERVERSRAAISRIEHGGSASYATIKAIASVLGVSTDELLYTAPSKKKGR